MNFLALIEAKREGRPLASDEIKVLVRAFATGKIPDYQMAAWLMAVFFRGLDREETRALALAMRDSGEVLKFPQDARPLVDKHSTGGVGDKVSLPLAPLLACLGFRVPMVSGRGLGITGGTLDKLESIPGFRTALEPDEIVRRVQEVGCVICGQTDRMVPADKAMYALRDVTGTIPSIPLITASILSKKLAEGLDALVLDVKFGGAAFMQTQDQARELALSLVSLGRECGVRTRALLTRMDQPLGRSVGNWLEVKEALACFEVNGPADLRELVVECAAQLLVLKERAHSMEKARLEARSCLDSGQPRRQWNRMLSAQGAHLDVFQSKLAIDTHASAVRELKAYRAGIVTACDARVVGEVVRDLGAGRLNRDTAINHDAGIDCLAKPGDQVAPGSLLARVHAGEEDQARLACQRLEKAFQIEDEPPPSGPLIVEMLE